MVGGQEGSFRQFLCKFEVREMISPFSVTEYSRSAFCHHGPGTFKGTLWRQPASHRGVELQELELHLCCPPDSRQSLCLTHAGCLIRAHVVGYKASESFRDAFFSSVEKAGARREGVKKPRVPGEHSGWGPCLLLAAGLLLSSNSPSFLRTRKHSHMPSLAFQLLVLNGRD